MNSIIDAIREAKEVKDSFIGSGKIGKLKYSIVGDREGYTITYRGSYNSVLSFVFGVDDTEVYFGFESYLGETFATAKIGNANSSSGIKQDRMIRVNSIKDSDDLAKELLVNIKEDDYLSIKQVLYVMEADMGIYRL